MSYTKYNSKPTDDHHDSFKHKGTLFVIDKIVGLESRTRYMCMDKHFTIRVFGDTVKEVRRLTKAKWKAYIKKQKK